MDTSLFVFINQGLQNSFLDYLMPLISRKWYLFVIAVAIISAMKDRKKGIMVFVLCLIAAAVADGGGNVLKHLIARPRPCLVLESVRLVGSGCGGSFSLPSNHALIAFTVAAVFSHFFRRAIVPMFLIAVLVALSRVYIGVHYPSDVLASAALGGVTAGCILFLYKWSTERYKEKPDTTVMIISLLALTLFRYYYLVTGPVGLGPDEAQYWDWSRRLDLSYYSKGPVIAYLIAASTWLTGDTVYGVRFFAPLLLLLGSVFIYRLTMELYHDTRKATAAALVFQITPLFAVFGVIMTIDAPFIFFWILSLYLFWKAVSGQKPEDKSLRSYEDENLSASQPLNFSTSRPDTLQRASHASKRYWYLLGLAVGLGLLTKYTMAFFYLCAFLFIVTSKDHRSQLKTPGPYLAFLLSLVVFSPVLIWNAGHDWVTFKHTAGQTHIAEGLRISIKDFFEFIGSQIGVLSPLLFFAVMIGAIRNYVNRQSSIVNRYLFWFWAPVLVFFVLKSLQAKVQANWAMFAYIAVFIAFADFFYSKTHKKWEKIFVTVALCLAFFQTAAAHYPKILNLPVKMDPSSRLRGWVELGIKTGEVYNSMLSSGSSEVFIFSDKYQVAGELAFYTPGQPYTYCVNLGRRMNQYDIWGGFDRLLGQDAIFVTIGEGDMPEALEKAFESHEKESFTVKEGDRILRQYSIFRSYDFKGLEPRKTESY
ncbi:undecaprenyl phosphate-alpha-4-amino-4-deoxy-L-arabinose arabinosyl transferase [bacterium BMS3Bbin08]|nr:undecaprenyl phosphate-alpha-4-amino-4-deoxy-L-arabinose arabinosyl transferase [bacterium BMS3Bbin08]HDH50300.1 phosphatase PAP2 family protein [Nitrospirota bacterium]